MQFFPSANPVGWYILLPSIMMLLTSPTACYRSSENFKKDPEDASRTWGTKTRELEKQYALRALSEAEREMLITRLPPHYMIHAYANCFDRDERSPEFVPWVQAFHPSANRDAWIKDRSQCMRLGLQALIAMMRQHIIFLSEQECMRARAPYKLPKDVLRRAFWRVDPMNSGYVSLAQFMQVCDSPCVAPDYH
jgi:hypothetical protein